jgi:hypothetical protein
MHVGSPGSGGDVLEVGPHGEAVLPDGGDELLGEGVGIGTVGEGDDARAGLQGRLGLPAVGRDFGNLGSAQQIGALA